MILVGEGSLLIKTINYCARQKKLIEAVVGPPNPTIERLSGELQFKYLCDGNTNDLLLAHDTDFRESVVLSINNRFVISDEVLCSFTVYNFHNGLVQSHRGIAEVCVLAAICQRSIQYGSTVHRLSPGEEIDAGRVVSQIAFPIPTALTFEELMTLSISKYLELVFSFIDSMDRPVTEGSYIHGTNVYSYKDVAGLLLHADEESLRRATYLGAYSHLLRKLRLRIEEFLGSSR